MSSITFLDFQHEGAASGLEAGDFLHVLNAVKARAAKGGGMTFDSASGAGGVRTKEFTQIVDSMLGEQLSRRDAGPAAGGTKGAGALRHVYAKILEEDRPLPNGLRLFSPDTEVPLGARTHEVQREFFRGSVKTWRGTDDNVPTVSRAQTSKVFKVDYYITQIMWSYFEELADGLSGDTSRVSRLLKAARDIMEAHANQRTWFGDPDGGLYGVLNYPWVTRLALAGNWNINATITDTEAYARALTRLVNYPTTESKQVFAPNRIAMGTRMHEFMANTLVKNSTTLLPMTLLDKFLKGNPHIRSESQIEICWELDNAYGDGVSAVVIYLDDSETISNVIPGGSMQNLPLIEKGYKSIMPMFMAHGGIVMRRVGNVVIALVDTSDPA